MRSLYSFISLSIYKIVMRPYYESISSKAVIFLNFCNSSSNLIRLYFVSFPIFYSKKRFS